MALLPMPGPEAAFRAYRDLVEQFDQANPMLLYYNGTNVFPVSVMGEDHLPALVAAINEMAQQYGPPKWLVHSNESYMKQVAGTESFEQHRYGDAKKAVEEGAPGATEAVVITGVSLTEAWHFQRPFKRTPHRVRWGESWVTHHYGIVEGGDSFGGPIADVLMQAIR